MEKYQDYRYMMKNRKEHKTALPELRFPEFRDTMGWIPNKIDHICKIGNGRDYKHLNTGKIPVYGSGGYMTSVDNYLYDGDSVCIGRKGTIDKPMFLSGKFWTVDTLFYTYSFQKCLPKFLHLLFQQINWYKYNEAGGVPSLSKTTIGNIDIFTPFDEDEQKKIADCFCSLDDLISAVADKIEALKEHKKGLMQQLFPAEGSTVPARRFPEFQNAPEWKETTLGKLFKIGNGKDYKHLNIGTIPVYGSGGYMTSVDDYLYDGESVCIGRKGTIDKPMFLTGKFWTVDTLFYTHSFVNCTPKFIYMYFQCINWLKHNEAGGVPSLSKTNIEKIRLFVPIDKKNAEQQKIANCLSSVDNLISAEIDKLDQLKAHKKGLMQRLFPKTYNRI